VLDWIRVSRLWINVLGERVFEKPLGVAEIGHHLGRSERVLLRRGAARDDVDAFRLATLDAPDLLDVARDLDQRTGLRGVGKLRIGDLVVEVDAQTARSLRIRIPRRSRIRALRRI